MDDRKLGTITVEDCSFCPFAGDDIDYLWCEHPAIVAAGDVRDLSEEPHWPPKWCPLYDAGVRIVKVGDG